MTSATQARRLKPPAAKLLRQLEYIVLISGVPALIVAMLFAGPLLEGQTAGPVFAMIGIVFAAVALPIAAFTMAIGGVITLVRHVGLAVAPGAASLLGAVAGAATISILAPESMAWSIALAFGAFPGAIAGLIWSDRPARMATMQDQPDV